MKRIFHAVIMTATLLGFLFVAGIGTQAKAEGIEGKSGIGLNLMFAMPSGEISSGDVAFSTEADSAVGYGLDYTYGLSKEYALNISIDKSSHDIKDSGTTFETVDITTLAIIGQYRYDMGASELSPYVGFGLGYSSVKHSLSSDANLLLCSDEFDVIDSCSNSIDGGGSSIALLINAGADYFITDNVAIAIEGRYTYSSVSPESKMNIEWSDGSTDEYTSSYDLDLSRIDLRGGLKYYF